MPRSPLTRWIALLAIVFCIWTAWHPQDSGWPVMSWLLPVDLLLLLATAAMLVRDAPPMDDRAFHLTRPPGRRGALLRGLGFSAGVASVVALAEGAHVLWLGFGGVALVYGMVAAFLVVWMILVAGMTVIGLALDPTRKVWPVLVIAIGLPVASFFLANVMRWGAQHALLNFQSDRWIGATLAVVAMAAVAYTVIWWLSAGRRSRGPALVLLACAGVAWPWIHRTGGWFPVGARPLAESEARILRLPPSGRVLSGTMGKDKVALAGRLNVRGLGEDEFVRFFSLSVRGHQLPTWAVAEHEAGGNAGVLTVRDPASAFLTNRDAFELLLPPLPAPKTTVESIGVDRKWNAVSAVNLEEWRSPKDHKLLMSREEFEDAAWNLSGVVHRFQKVGEVPAAEGGNLRLKDGGRLWIRPLTVDWKGLCLRLHAEVPRWPFGSSWMMDSGEFMGMRGGENLWLLFHDERDGIVRVVQPQTQSWYGSANGWGSGEGLVSRWRDSTVVFQMPPNETRDPREESVRRSKVYVFLSQPVARVNAELAPAR